MAETRRRNTRPAGEAIFFGDPATVKVLEAALRDVGEVERATHGFHTYPASLHPDAARRLLSLGEGPVLDPFCGGGTVLVEALLMGRPALGLDISPISNLVARARTLRTNESLRTALRSNARSLSDYAKHPPEPRGIPIELREWYHPTALAELAALRSGIAMVEDKEVAFLLRAVFSSILVKVSHRESDTANHMVERPREPESTAILFHARAREYARKLEEFENAVAATGVDDSIRARVHREDARDFRVKDRFGMVVTSPPYPGVYDYLTMQQLRYLWLELDPGDTKEIGSRRSFRLDRGKATERWRADTHKWLKAVHKVMLPGARMAVVLGDGNVNGKTVESVPPLLEGATTLGMRSVAQCTVERWDEGSGGLRMEHAVLLEKAGE